MAYLDDAVTGFGGIALSYAGFYGAANDGWGDLVRQRKFPIVGRGGNRARVWSSGACRFTNIVDDEPAPVREWLPVLAQAMGAEPPRHFPAWLKRLFAGEAAVAIGTESRGASNAKAKRELGWTLRYPSWRQGFAAAYASTTPADGARAAISRLWRPSATSRSTSRSLELDHNPAPASGWDP
jgi:hypothetical protein